VLSREHPTRRASSLRSVLSQFDATLPTRVSRTVTHLRQQGLDPANALREGLARSLADASIARIQQIGRARGGLGQVATTPVPAPTTQTTRDAGQVIGTMLQGMTCSPQMRDAIIRMVQQHDGSTSAGVTATGFSFAGGAVNCPGSMESLPVPPDTSVDMSTVTAPAAWVPAAIGIGAVLIIGIAAVATRPR